MPELPEIEIIVQDLRRLQGKVVERIQLYSDEILRTPARYWQNCLCQKRLLAVTRKAKYILFRLENSLKLIMHLGMTGQLLLREFPSDLPDKHTHMLIDFGTDKLYYRDIRKFGFVDLARFENAVSDSYFKNVGYDPLEIGRETWVPLLKKSKARIKPLLLSQKLVAGLGNIYVDETLFRAGIHPKRKASQLSTKRLAQLYDAMRLVLEEAIQNGGSSIDDYVHPDGSRGSFQLSHQVYGKEGRPCPQCGRVIKKIKLGGRGTSFCSHCQR